MLYTTIALTTAKVINDRSWYVSTHSGKVAIASTIAAKATRGSTRRRPPARVARTALLSPAAPPSRWSACSGSPPAASALRKSPYGRHRMMATITTSRIAYDHSSETYAPPSVSAVARTSAATTTPRMLPRPPTIATAKPLSRNAEPKNAVNGKIVPSRPPASADAQDLRAGPILGEGPDSSTVVRALEKPEEHAARGRRDQDEEHSLLDQHDWPHVPDAREHRWDRVEHPRPFDR